MQAWESLEEAEYQRELALRSELIRQEKLEQLARRFDRKAAMRETWLSENQRLVTQVRGAYHGRRGEVLQATTVDGIGARVSLSSSQGNPSSALQCLSLLFRVEPHILEQDPQSILCWL